MAAYQEREGELPHSGKQEVSAAMGVCDVLPTAKP